MNRIRSVPDRLVIDFVGELAGHFALGTNRNARSDYAAGGSVTLVAGVRHDRKRTIVVLHV